ncbi:MAG: cell envelope integrity protein TolA [Steroidobacteraceae bacterium]
MQRWQAYGLSIAIHLGLAIAILIAGFLFDRPVIAPASSVSIEAVVMLEAPSRPSPVVPAPMPMPSEEAPSSVEAVSEDSEAEREALEARKAQAELEAQAAREAAERIAREKAAQEAQAAEEKRRAQAQRIADEKRRVEEKRIAEEKRRAEEMRVAEEKRRAEEKRLAEQKRRAEIDAQIKAAREQELARQRESEERQQAQRRLQQSAEWAAAIQSKVERAWIRPPTTQAGLDCLVRVTQVPGGAVVGVEVRVCNADAVVRQSIEAAAFRASPLPPPPDPALFERIVELRFKPRDQ